MPIDSKEEHPANTLCQNIAKSVAKLDNMIQLHATMGAFWNASRTSQPPEKKENPGAWPRFSTLNF
jgi:hypothetical protein